MSLWSDVWNDKKKENIDTVLTDNDLLTVSALGSLFILKYSNGKSLTFKHGPYHSKTPRFMSKSFCEFLHPSFTFPPKALSFQYHSLPPRPYCGLWGVQTSWGLYCPSSSCLARSLSKAGIQRTVVECMRGVRVNRWNTPGKPPS